MLAEARSEGGDHGRLGRERHELKTTSARIAEGDHGRLVAWRPGPGTTRHHRVLAADGELGEAATPIADDDAPLEHAVLTIDDGVRSAREAKGEKIRRVRVEMLVGVGGALRRVDRLRVTEVWPRGYGVQQRVFADGQRRKATVVEATRRRAPLILGLEVRRQDIGRADAVLRIEDLFPHAVAPGEQISGAADHEDLLVPLLIEVRKERDGLGGAVTEDARNAKATLRTDRTERFPAGLVLITPGVRVHLAAGVEDEHGVDGVAVDNVGKHSGRAHERVVPRKEMVLPEVAALAVLLEVPQMAVEATHPDPPRDRRAAGVVDHRGQ